MANLHLPFDQGVGNAYRGALLQGVHPLLEGAAWDCGAHESTTSNFENSPQQGAFAMSAAAPRATPMSEQPSQSKLIVRGGLFSPSLSARMVICQGFVVLLLARG